MSKSTALTNSPFRFRPEFTFQGASAVGLSETYIQLSKIFSWGHYRMGYGVLLLLCAIYP